MEVYELISSEKLIVLINLLTDGDANESCQTWNFFLILRNRFLKL